VKQVVEEATNGAAAVHDVIPVPQVVQVGVPVLGK